MGKLFTKINTPSTLFILFATLLGSGVFYFSLNSSSKNIQAKLKPTEEIGAFPIIQPTIKYGFAVDTFQVIEGKIETGLFFSDLLQQYHIPYENIDKIVHNSKDIFNVGRLIAGRPYAILTKDSTQMADYLVYESSVFDYIVFDLKDKLNAVKKSHPIETKEKAAAGVVESSLWNAMVGNGMSFTLAARLEDALQWSIDFHHIQKNDKFRLIYDEQFIEGKSVDIRDLHAAYFKNGETEYYAFYYTSEDGKHEGFYDENGHPMKKGFLKSPVKYSRISSRYNLKRFHPVLKRVRPHYGTDYAAPYGTPIFAVGDGVIERQGYTKGNGNFIKIKHDGTYQTQYLHMQKFGEGMHIGRNVKQGEIIGYVGSTGLATGPHVCFRFWKNNKQVNHLSLKFPPAKPLPDAEMERFNTTRDAFLARFEQLPYPEVSVKKEAKEAAEKPSATKELTVTDKMTKGKNS